jgi:hypothetical protein
VFQYSYRVALEWLGIAVCLFAANYSKSIVAYIAGAYVIGILQLFSSNA